MIPTKTIKLYDGKVTIEFYEGRHQYFVNGQRVYGVTNYTGLIDKSRVLIYWAVNLTRDYLLEKLVTQSITEDIIWEASKQHSIRKQAAADKGTQVHALAELWIKSTPATRKEIEMPEDEDVANGYMAFLDWVKTHRIKFLASEKMVYSRAWQYVGTLDCEFTMGEEKHAVRHMGDFKTSSGVYPEMIFQVTAYEEAVREEENYLVEKRKMKKSDALPWGDKYILRFDKKTGDFFPYCIPAENHAADFEAFGGLVVAKRRLAEIEQSFKPA